jgi:UDP-N-acetylmuramoyl-L-alanyl-D-glutamate--2,6-diaminopimelate ligase
MILEKLIENIKVEKIIGEAKMPITGLAFDSREVKKGYLFIAQRGTNTDGHKFIDNAIENGAVAIICEFIPENTIPGVTFVKTDSASKALGMAASAFYGNPSSKLKLIGVTGTNGKITIATLLQRLVMNLGFGAGLISTISYKINDKEYDASHTTPDQLTLNKFMFQMVEDGCEYCIMEVSSHAVDQQRIAGLDFDGAVFTNITHDHLDYHKTFDAYIKAKKQFFDMLKPEAFALTNIDDKNGRVMLQNTAAEKKTYSLQSLANFKCKIIESHFDGTLLKIDENELWTHFVGKFNAYNLLAVYGAAYLLGFAQQEVLVEMSKLMPVAGRFEIVRSDMGVYAVVDYAHTPDALDNVLQAISELRTKNEQLICVVGAGGDRDKTKRPEMAQIACRYSDRIILTSDNPRSEDPNDILKDMEAGVDPVSRKKTLTISERREAIKTAAMLAAPGDIILIAGKGHETYQEVKGIRHHFDDKEEIMKAFGLI